MVMNDDPDGVEWNLRAVRVTKASGCLSCSSHPNLMWASNWRIFIRSTKGKRLQVVSKIFMKYGK